MQNTNIIQGRFVSTGANTSIAIPMGVDWFEIIDYTKAGANGASATDFVGVRYYWQLGMADGTGQVEYKSNSSNAINMDTLAFGGFTLVDTSGSPVGTITTTTGDGATTGASIDASSPRIVTIDEATIAPLVYSRLLGKDIVRMSRLSGGTAAPLFAGIDFTFASLTAASATQTTFTLSNTNTGVANAGTATFNTADIIPIKWNPYWYPSIRNIYGMKSSGVNTIVYPTVKPFYVVGQSVRINVPQNTPTGTDWGMSQINGLVGNVVAVATSAPWSFTIDIDSSGFTTFNQPGSASMPITTQGVQWASVVPIGDVAMQILDTSGNPIPTNAFNESTFNQAYMGIVLGVGGTDSGASSGTPNISGPAGKEGDVMYWRAGKSFSNTVGLYPVPPVPPLGS